MRPAWCARALPRDQRRRRWYPCGCRPGMDSYPPRCTATGSALTRLGTTVSPLPFNCWAASKQGHRARPRRVRAAGCGDAAAERHQERLATIPPSRENNGKTQQIRDDNLISIIRSTSQPHHLSHERGSAKRPGPSYTKPRPLPLPLGVDTPWVGVPQTRASTHVHGKRGTQFRIAGQRPSHVRPLRAG